MSLKAGAKEAVAPFEVRHFLGQIVIADESTFRTQAEVQETAIADDHALRPLELVHT